MFIEYDYDNCKGEFSAIQQLAPTLNINFNDIECVLRYIINNTKYTYFIEVFDLLVKNSSLKEKEKSIEIVTATLLEINESFKKA